ncbi:MAG: glycosyltransferase family 2 protein [Longimicrobiales bacterium]
MAAVIVSYGTRELTLRAVTSVLASRGVAVEIHVVDNASSDGSADAVRQRYPQVDVMVQAENLGFGRGNNVGLERTDAPFVLLLNSDATFAEEGGLLRLVEAMRSDDRIGVVGPRLESPGRALEFSARAFPGIAAELVRSFGLHRLLTHGARARLLASEFHDHRSRGDVDWLTGACLLVRRAAVDHVGGFDPEIFLYGEELEWCWRIRNGGWRILFEPDVTAIHERGASSVDTPAWRMRLAMAGEAYAVRKHRGQAYLAAFFLARCLGLMAEMVLQGLAGTVTGSRERRSRATRAAKGIGAWVAVLLGGGSSHPGRMASRGMFR